MSYGIFEQILSIIILSVIVIAIFRRLNLPSILGYLAVGILIAIIDRYAFKDIQSFNILAKYGVVFLLFTIGLEFSIARLLALKKIVFLFGGLQVVICTLVFWGIGLLFHLSQSNAFIIGATLALSSTALISKVLSEAGEVQTHTGRMTIGVLIFQDIMVVPLLIITSILANNDGSDMWRHMTSELIIGCITFIMLYFIGRLLLTPFFKEIARARSNELFVLAALMTALAAAYFSDIMGMSKELGAFLAGVILAGTPYHKQVASDIRPFRDVLLGLFFIGIGMSLDINALPQTGFWIVLVGLLIVGIKLLLIPFIPIVLRLSDKQQAFRTGLLLAQGGEFGFVLVAIASHFRLIQSFHGQVLIGAIIFSMIVSLILIQLQKPIAFYLKKRNQNLENQYSPEKINTEPHVIICGFGYTGQQVARILKTANVAYSAIDTDASCVSQAALAGEPVYYGDASNHDILISLGLKNAQAVVVCFNNEAIAQDIHELIQEDIQRLPLIIRIKLSEDSTLSNTSTVSIIDEGIEIGFLLGKQVLNAMGFSKNKLAKITAQAKKQIKYEFFRGDMIESEEKQADSAQLYSFRVHKEAHLAGKSLAECHIDISSIKLRGIRSHHGEKRELNENTLIHANDILIVFGELDAIEAFEAAVQN